MHSTRRKSPCAVRMMNNPKKTKRSITIYSLSPLRLPKIHRRAKSARNFLGQTLGYLNEIKIRSRSRTPSELCSPHLRQWRIYCVLFDAIKKAIWNEGVWGNVKTGFVYKCRYSVFKCQKEASFALQGNVQFCEVNSLENRISVQLCMIMNTVDIFIVLIGWCIMLILYWRSSSENWCNY